jgi:hypothetical protein
VGPYLLLRGESDVVVEALNDRLFWCSDQEVGRQHRVAEQGILLILQASAQSKLGVL